MYYIDSYGARRELIEIQCHNCQKQAFKDKRDIKKNKSKIFFCSRDCSNKFRGKDTQNVCCTNCNKEIIRKKSTVEKNKTGIYFCSRSCQITAQQKGVVRNGVLNPNYIFSKEQKIHPPLTPCMSCGKNCKKEYCSAICRNQHKYLSYIQRWKDGLETGNYQNNETLHQYIRRYIFDKYQSKCCKCGWNQIHSITKKIPLSINHIDGISSNSVENNLELLCPNCHSLTDNYGSLNVGNGRRNRLQKLKN